MTQDRALKRAIRQRMQETGEKYSKRLWTLYALQLTSVLPRTPASGVGRGPSAAGGWLLLNRCNVERRAAAIAASTPLVEAGLRRQIERNRQIVERVLALRNSAPVDQLRAAAEGRRR